MSKANPNSVRQRAIAAGIAVRTVYDRLYSGMTIDEAISAPLALFERGVRYSYSGLTLTLPEWSEELGICLATLHTRLDRGWSVQRTLTTLARPSQRRTGGWSRTFRTGQGTGRGGTRKIGPK